MIRYRHHRISDRAAAALCGFALSILLAGCAGSSPEHLGPYQPEDFNSTTTHSRSFPVSEAEACEAARRALLSQGYQISNAGVESVNGRKSFQPSAETHLEVEFRVVCAREHPGPAPGPHSAIVFVTAVQDRFGLKKVNNSASVGVGVLGSLSLPFTSSDDAMVKIASQTLTDEHFYERFYELMGRFLKASEPAAAESPDAVPGEEAPVITSPVQRQPLSEATPLPEAPPLDLPPAAAKDAPLAAPDAAAAAGTEAARPTLAAGQNQSPHKAAAEAPDPVQVQPARPPEGEPKAEPQGQPGQQQRMPHVMFST